ncbi:50S ribosomal protein L22 [Patescibacteria group bacterium]|nr:50S ribosomal protein L22 [Patescibacteria group bacterium]MBU4466765.1 50S ribosomal protein L22 [Patescibacteria group bacterium]
MIKDAQQQVVAKLNDLRIAPRKLRLVADLVRGQDALTAKTKLSFLVKRGARPFLKLLDSALANARNNFQLDEKDLYLAKVLVDEGRKLKRWRPRSRGQAFPIQKKTSHLTIVLEPKKGALGSKLKKIKKTEIKKESQEKAKTAKPKIKSEAEALKPKSVPGLKKIFRRKV